jgi:hypothetical protein
MCWLLVVAGRVITLTLVVVVVQEGLYSLQYPYNHKAFQSPLEMVDQEIVIKTVMIVKRLGSQPLVVVLGVAIVVLMGMMVVPVVVVAGKEETGAPGYNQTAQMAVSVTMAATKSVMALTIHRVAVVVLVDREKHPREVQVKATVETAWISRQNLERSLEKTGSLQVVVVVV